MTKYSVILASVSAFVWIQSAFSFTACPAYCNSAGDYVDTTSCVLPQPYCCGNVTTRFCCSDASSDITSVYRDVCFCPISNCMNNNWETIASATTTVFLFMVIFICCLYNQIHRQKRCRKCRWIRMSPCCRDNSTVDVSDDNIPTVSSTVVEGQSNTGDFDPSSPFAFEPPPYDVVIKNPPRYDDLIIEELDTTDSPPITYEETARTEARTEISGADSGALGTTDVGECGASSDSSMSDNPPPYCAVDITDTSQQTSAV